MNRPFHWTSVIVLVAACIACGGEKPEKTVPLPELDGTSAKGLEIECSLVKTKFVVGEPVNIWCTIKNTTDGVKPVGWHSVTGEHFCCVQADKGAWEGGLLPLALPQLDRPVLIKSKDWAPGYVLFIPPHESIRFILTSKPDRPQKFKGRTVYDPIGTREGWTTWTKEEGPPWKGELVSSNQFEYEIAPADKK